MGLQNKTNTSGSHASCISPTQDGQRARPVLADYFSYAHSVSTTVQHKARPGSRSELDVRPGTSNKPEQPTDDFHVDVTVVGLRLSA